MILSSPYRGLPASAFWRKGVAEASYPPENLFVPRQVVTKQDRIVTAGSCFAQHVGRTLRNLGYNVLDKEPASEDPRAIDDPAAHGYNLYSARYGNIYTARQLRQILLEALGREAPADLVWERKGRFFDSMRPNIEPEGFESEAALRSARARHLSCVLEAFTEANLFVFTLGLTEAWTHRPSGQVYATAPGTIAGSYDPAIHEFKNFRQHEIMSDLRATWQLLRGINPTLRMLLTVSPVPLAATATGDHVLCATTYSKSVLRACAGEMREDFPEIDYFPSYEIITSPRAGRVFFEDNLRSVSADGVALAMKTFVEAQMSGTPPVAEPEVLREPTPAQDHGTLKIAGVIIPESNASTKPAFLARVRALGVNKPEDITCAAAVVRAGDRVVEIGAGLGILSAFLAKSSHPSAIRSYEAKPKLVAAARDLHIANGVEGKIDLRHATVLPLSGGTTEDAVSFPDIMAEFAPDVLVINTKGDEVDFLMKADLGTLRALVVQWHPKVTPVEELRKCKRLLKAAGFEPIEAVSSRATWAAVRDM